MDEDTERGLERLRHELGRLAGGGGGEQSAAFLRSVLAHMPAMCLALTPDGRLLYVNHTAAGVTEEEVLGSTLFDFMAPGTDGPAREAVARVVETGRPGGYVGYGAGRRGPRSRYENWLGPILADGRVIALTLITRDVSEEWEIQQQLRERGAQLHAALEASDLGLYRVNLRAREVELDERVQDIYRADRSTYSIEAFDAFLHPQDRRRVKGAAMEAITRGGRYASENRITRGDGSVGWVSVTGVVVTDDDGRASEMLGTILDTTERRELEDQLRQAQKLEAVGQLTAGIAHNFNNMLASILPTLELVQYDVSPENRELVDAAQEAARRAAQMVRELLTFSGKRPPTREAVDVTSLVDRVLRICRTTFDRAITIEASCAPACPPLGADAAQIEQALMNILINGRDALLEARAERPRLLIDVDVDTPDPANGPMVRIRVSDNGPGMSPEIAERIFEPFFTTKEVGRGTGLGLSTTYGIVREHGGVLRCESDEGRGTTFSLWLPFTGGVAEAPREERDIAPGAQQGSVLIVDDEEVVRTAARRVLEDAGYDVHLATDGEEALAVLGRSSVQLVLLDLNMPGMAWTDVLSAIRARHPGVKVVAFTGKLAHEDVEGMDAIVEKPASPDVLRRAVERVLSD